MTKEEYEILAEELLTNIPVKYHEGIKTLAWEWGHAYGYNEVYIHLQEIVETIFKGK
jgi:hypothetical protein